MSFSEMPDIEAVCIAALRAADVADERVYGSVPATPVYPLVKLERVGGVPAIRRRLDRASIQVSAYADDRETARDVAELARRVLHDAEATAFEDFNAYVTGVEDELGLQYVPDPETTRERYLFSVAVFAHHKA